MTKQILQIETTSKEELISEVVDAMDKRLKIFYASNTKEDKLMSREETAEMLSISLVTLWKWTKTDILPAFRIGSKVRYKKSEILLALKKMNQFKN